MPKTGNRKKFQKRIDFNIITGVILFFSNAVNEVPKTGNRKKFQKRFDFNIITTVIFFSNSYATEVSLTLYVKDLHDSFHKNK